MKKLLLTILSCLMLVSCCLLGGCNSGEVYKLSKIKYYDDEKEMTVTVEVGDKYNGTLIKDDTYILILDGDNAFLRFSETEENGEVDLEVYAFTWSKGYNNEYYACDLLRMTYSFVATKTDNQISFDFYDETLIFVK